MQLNSRHHQLLCRMALFAMLMLFVGPLISQTQHFIETSSAVASNQGTGTSAHQHHTEHQHHTGHHHANSSDRLHQSLLADLSNISSHLDLSACDYCVLCAYMPGLNVAISIPDALPPTMRSLWYAPQQKIWTTLAHLRPGPRAPPSSFVVSS